MSSSHSSSHAFPSLFRGITGHLPTKFFVPDERGMIVATEFAFMSTTLNEAIGQGFTSTNLGGIFLEIRPRRRDAGGYHMGAKLEWLSRSSKEREVLFPPYTLFRVIKRERNLDTRLTKIIVVPTYRKLLKEPLSLRKRWSSTMQTIREKTTRRLKRISLPRFDESRLPGQKIPITAKVKALLPNFGNSDIANFTETDLQ